MVWEAGVIEFARVTYTYPQQTQAALQEVTLRVQPGEFVLLTGPSGSGKSTLLRCLNGLIPHLSGGTLQGEVRVHGLDPVAVGPQQMSQHVGFVFQNPEAQAVLERVEAEVAFGLECSAEFRPRRQRESRAERAAAQQAMRARLAETLATLHLTPLRQRPLHTLSGGERQKVALACALALRPAVMALDEPTSQLDPQAAAELLDTLVRLNRQAGLTILLAEHRLERVLPFVSRVVYLENGRITLDAPTQEATAHLPRMSSLLTQNWPAQPPPPTPGAQAPKEDGSAPERPERPPTGIVLAVNGVTFRYGQTAVLQDVSLTVRTGELVALLGHNGAGKSTLLRCITGLLQPQAGEIWVNGRSTRGQAVADICREVAYLPQNPDDLLFSESVAAELAVTQRNHRLAADETAVDRLLAELGLLELKNAYPRDLSVGQRQRVALAAVTITQPPLIMLDEPTRGLDSAAKAALVAIWRGWLAQGKAILLVTHDVELVKQVAHRAVVLQAGQVLAEGETAVVLHQSFPVTHPQLTPIALA